VQPWEIAGIEFDFDSRRVDVDTVHRYLSEDSYWAKGRSRDAVELSIANSAAVLGAYDGDRLIGFGRTVSDGVAVAYLADVFVLPEYRGRGIGSELVRALVTSDGWSGLRWLLRTDDAHDLYSRFGFTPAGSLVMERPPTSPAQSGRVEE
jgi:predicted N-acetyltransferase YhbS